MKQSNYNFLQDFTKNSSQVESDDSSELLFDLTQDTIPLSQEGSTIYIEGLA